MDAQCYNSRQSNVYFKKIYQIHSSLHQTTQQTDDLQYFHQCLPSTLALADTKSCNIILATNAHILDCAYTHPTQKYYGRFRGSSARNTLCCTLSFTAGKIGIVSPIA